MMKPHIICYMYASLDGRIDCDMTDKIDDGSAYEKVFDRLSSMSMISGRITRALHNALPDEFMCKNYEACGECFYKAEEAPSGYEISMDTYGTLMWNSKSINNKSLLCIVSEKASKEYLTYLKSKGISYIACGTSKINISKAMNILNKEFGIEKIALVGGGHINGAFLDANLIDEVWMMYGAGIDGREGWASCFDGRASECNPIRLSLTNVEKFENNCVLLQYKI